MSSSFDTSQKADLSQKEYLKRYLSKDKGDKKKKKKQKISSSTHLKRSVIIDDDLGLPNVASIEDEEFNLDYLGDEAPQVAGIIDERPPEIKAKESHGVNKWKPIGELEDQDLIQKSLAKLIEKKISSNEKSPNSEIVNSDSGTNKSKRNNSASLKERRLRDSDSDISPPRARNQYEGKENKSGRRSYSKDDDSDLSPPRTKAKRGESEHFSKRSSKRSVSPHRGRKNSHVKDSSYKHGRYQRGHESPNMIRDKYQQRDDSKPRNRSPKGSDSDISPPRRKKFEERSNREKHRSDYKYPPGKSNHEGKSKSRGSDSDLSPPRKSRYEKGVKRKGSDSDLSPPRKNKFDKGAKRKGSDSDLSPPRKNKFTKGDKRKGSDSDLSPPRKNKFTKGDKRKGSDSDFSPPRKNKYDGKTKKVSSNVYKKGYDSDLSPTRKSRRDKNEGSESDLSPPRKTKHDRFEKRYKQDRSSPERNKIEEKNNSKNMDKTLDGKKAGLQDAKNLKEELRLLKEQENAMYEKMKASVSGTGTTAVLRDRKTGKIRDLNKEKEEQSKKHARVAEREQKYAKWGKGLKQIEEIEDKIADYLHEAKKPLARYAGDDDLEKILKAREREGDPMLDYIRNKQSESIDLDVKGKPTYQGYYLPNRFNVRPGHRWDGVDRSNGYEKKWFERQNAKKALQEEAYKWSTSDM